jgi:hypothetical protein
MCILKSKIDVRAGVADQQAAGPGDAAAGGLHGEHGGGGRAAPEPLLTPVPGAAGVHQRQPLLRRRGALPVWLRRGERLVRTLPAAAAAAAVPAGGGGGAHVAVRRPRRQLVQGVLPAAQEAGAHPPPAALRQLRQGPLVQLTNRHRQLVAVLRRPCHHGLKHVRLAV